VANLIIFISKNGEKHLQITLKRSSLWGLLLLFFFGGICRNISPICEISPQKKKTQKKRLFAF